MAMIKMIITEVHSHNGTYLFDDEVKNQKDQFRYRNSLKNTIT